MSTDDYKFSYPLGFLYNPRRSKSHIREKHLGILSGLLLNSLQGHRQEGYYLETQTDDELYVNMNMLHDLEIIPFGFP